MSDLRELYQEVILDHSKNPRHYHPLDDADRRAEGHNPLCGDKITVFVRTDGERVREIAFQGSGCAISTASASMMAQALEGATRAEIEERFETFHRLVTGKLDFEAASDKLGKLAVFAGVCKFPVRVKCATLAWHTLLAALDQNGSTVSTEGVDTDGLRKRVIEALKTCYDPEIPVDIYELGLIYDVKTDADGAVDIKMTLTSPACPVAGSLPGEVEHKVRSVEGVTRANVELVWEPAWDKDRMSEAAKVTLGFF